MEAKKLPTKANVAECIKEHLDAVREEIARTGSKPQDEVTDIVLERVTREFNNQELGKALARSMVENSSKRYVKSHGLLLPTQDRMERSANSRARGIRQT